MFVPLLPFSTESLSRVIVSSDRSAWSLLCPHRLSPPPLVTSFQPWTSSPGLVPTLPPLEPPQAAGSQACDFPHILPCVTLLGPHSGSSVRATARLALEDVPGPFHLERDFPLPVSLLPSLLFLCSSLPPSSGLDSPPHRERAPHFLHTPGTIPSHTALEGRAALGLHLPLLCGYSPPALS